MVLEPEGGLQDGESVRVFFRPSRWIYTPWYFIGLAAAIGVFTVLEPLRWFFNPNTVLYGIGMVFTSLVAGLAVLVTAELHLRGHKFFVTDERVVRQFKFFEISFDQGTFDLITDVNVNQNLVERILRIGDVRVSAASGEVILFRGVRSPREIKNHITEAKHDYGETDEDLQECEECGETVSESDNYCPKCGEEL